MKKKWTVLLIIIFGVFMIFIGCQKRESTKEEMYAGFQNKISEMRSYSCKAEVEVIGNKSPQTYIMTHNYKKPNYYKVEVVSPDYLKGKTMEYKENKILIKNPEIDDVVELPNVGTNSQYLFIGDFIKNYLQNEEVEINISKDSLIIETLIPGEDKYFNKQVLYLDIKTKSPVKMEILDEKGSIIFKVKYSEFRSEN